MDTSRVQFFNEILDLDHLTIPLGKIAFFRERFRNRLHQLVLQKFITLEDTRGFSRADLARRIGRKPEQVTRWLGAPGNWTLDTVSDLLLGMAAELDCDVTFLEKKLALPPQPEIAAMLNKLRARAPSAPPRPPVVFPAQMEKQNTPRSERPASLI